MGLSSARRGLRIGGIQKNSLIDFPGKVSCVIFATGCNFRCPYCHNPELVVADGGGYTKMGGEFLWEFLRQRGGFLDGVVISGGEPTLQSGIFGFCERLKGLGYAVKLDTNGSRPGVVENLLRSGLVDYVAMDVKSNLDDYHLFTSESLIITKIRKSINIIMEFAPAYEFRTTCVKPIINKDSIQNIANMISGAMLYALQRCRKIKVLCPDFFRNGGGIYRESELLQLRSIILSSVRECMIR